MRIENPSPNLRLQKSKIHKSTPNVSKAIPVQDSVMAWQTCQCNSVWVTSHMAGVPCDWDILVHCQPCAADPTIPRHKSLEKHSVSRLFYLFGHLHLLSSHSFSSLIFSLLNFLCLCPALLFICLYYRKFDF